MAKTIRDIGPSARVIRDSSPGFPKVSTERVAAALGAEPLGEDLGGAIAPITFFAVRAELAARLQSSGGRPSLSGTSRRAKVPVSDVEWAELEGLATALSGPGFSPSAGQIASVLLGLAVRAVVAQVAKAPTPAESPLARDLAARAAAAESAD